MWFILGLFGLIGLNIVILGVKALQQAYLDSMKCKIIPQNTNQLTQSTNEQSLGRKILSSLAESSKDESSSLNGMQSDGFYIDGYKVESYEEDY